MTTSAIDGNARERREGVMKHRVAVQLHESFGLADIESAAATRGDE